MSYDASINNGGTAQINTGTAASACEVVLGASSATHDSGKLSVDGGGSSLTVCTTTIVGSQGTGSLSITNGGVVTSVSASIASLTGSTGAVTVDGTNSTWTVANELEVGGLPGASGGTGLLTVTNSGTVAAGSVDVWKSATLTGNSTVSTTSGTTIVGTIQPSSGRLTISSGNLIFSGSAALMQTKVAPASADNVYVSAGAATLTGKLSVSMSGTFTCRTTYTLLHAANGLGSSTFSSVSITYPTGQCFTPQIQYTATDVNLYLAPAACCP